MMKKTDGFTLVELMVGILCAAVVTGAAISVMLMNARINRTVIDANVDQQDMRIITSLVENLASEGSISTVKYIQNTATGTTDWVLLEGVDSDSKEILTFRAGTQTLHTDDDTVLMSGVLNSSLSISRNVLNGCMLNLVIETTAGKYQTSIYCRTNSMEEWVFSIDKDDAELTISKDDTNVEIETVKPIDPTHSTTEISDKGRLAFLSVLASQVGSGGYINNNPSEGTYSLWYCEDESKNSGYLPGWNASTPWCGCFISWAVAQTSATTTYSPVGFTSFANVDNAWANYKNNPPASITPGDLIFFSWDNDTDRLEHVGVVLYVDSSRGYIYTIEGNSSNQVALRRYSRDDSRIVGYGVLNWNSTTP